MTGRFLLRRLALAVAVLLTVSMISFGLLLLSGAWPRRWPATRRVRSMSSSCATNTALDRPLPVHTPPGSAAC